VTRTEYEAAVARMRAVEGGTLKEVDYEGRDGRCSYRHATLSVSGGQCLARAPEWTLLAVETGAYLTFHASGEHHLSVAVSRDLEPSEVAARAACGESL